MRATRSTNGQARELDSLGDWYRRTGSRWLRNLAIACFAVVVFLTGGQLLVERMEPGNLPIRQIELRGDLSRVDVDAVKALVGPYVSGGVMRADVHHVATLVAKEPWVSRAWVRKRWPDTLEIQITVHHPVARWGDGQWIDEDGVVFAGSEQPDQDRFDWLTAPDSLALPVLEAYRDYSRRLAAIDVDLRRIIVDQRRAWRLETADRMSIELGRQDMNSRFSRFVAVYSGRLQAEPGTEQRRLLQADMRYPHGLAVRWEPQQQPDAGSPPMADKG